jgi:hypothetical protein
MREAIRLMREAIRDRVTERGAHLGGRRARYDAEHLQGILYDARYDARGVAAVSVQLERKVQQRVLDGFRHLLALELVRVHAP